VCVRVKERGRVREKSGGGEGVLPGHWKRGEGARCSEKGMPQIAEMVVIRGVLSGFQRFWIVVKDSLGLLDELAICCPVLSD
jgi:hypothetical protein